MSLLAELEYRCVAFDQHNCHRHKCLHSQTSFELILFLVGSGHSKSRKSILPPKEALARFALLSLSISRTLPLHLLIQAAPTLSVNHFLSFHMVRRNHLAWFNPMVRPFGEKSFNRIMVNISI